jgi:hypothetical protein
MTRWLYQLGLRGWQMHAASLGSVGLCIVRPGANSHYFSA